MEIYANRAVLSCFKYVLLMFLCIFLFEDQVTNAQSHSQDIVVQSWKRGKAIVQKNMSVTFDENVDEFETDLSDTTGEKLYRFKMKKIFMQTKQKPSVQCWSVALKELLRDSNNGGFVLGDNLLSTGEVFDTYAMFFCPIEEPVGILDKPQFSIRRTRKFLVENFALEMKVLDYTYDEQKGRLNKASFFINADNLKSNFQSLSNPVPVDRQNHFRKLNYRQVDN